MSTRAQVLINSTGLSWKETPCLLYHHSDGYPDYILPKIREAFDYHFPNGCGGWAKGRVSKVASLLCAVDPAEFEPEERIFDRDGNLLFHGDIDYIYTICITNFHGGCIAEQPQWDVRIYKTDKNNFWDDSTIQNIKQIQHETWACQE